MKRIIALALLASSMALQAQGGGRDADFGTVLMNYFRNEKTDIVQATKRYFKDVEAIEDSMKAPIMGFYAILFRDDKLEKKVMSAIERNGNEDVTALFRKIAALDIDALYGRETPNYMINDMMWGSFYASGDEKYILKILKTAHDYRGEEKDFMLYMTAYTALWSLASNSEQFSEVDDFLESQRDGEYGTTVAYILGTDPGEIQEEMRATVEKKREAKVW